MTLASYLSPPARLSLRAHQRRKTTEQIAHPVMIQAELKFRGNNARLQSSCDREMILSGPSETGKTIACLQHLDTLARTHPQARGAIVRKVRADMSSTVLDVFKREFVDRLGDITLFGGENVEFYEWPNGARVFVGGMDRPGKVLSGALDFAYVNQAEELHLEDWETLSTRTSGRAGKIIPGLLFGDCNPGPAYHWIKQRPALMMLETRHEDNPALFDAEGAITERGQQAFITLDALTGTRYLRLRKGLWVNAEGVVYEEFDEAIHVIDRFEIPAQARLIRAIDFGYQNPFVCGWLYVDPDERLYLYRLIYMTHRLVEDHARQIAALSADERIEATVADHDAEDRATLERHGISTRLALKDISPGLQAVQRRLRKQGDGKARFYIFRDCLVEADETLREAHKPIDAVSEFAAYVWPKAADGKPIKETPIDHDNHALDMIRYAAMYLDGSGGPPASAMARRETVHARRPRSSWNVRS